MNGYKTYLGLLVALAPTLAHLFGFTVTPSFGQQFPVLLDSIVQLGGLGFAAYGRAVAEFPGWFAKTAE